MIAQTESLRGYAAENRFDDSGNLIEEKVFKDDETFVTTYEYDAASQLIRIDRWDGASASFEYDANGNLVNETDFLGNTVRFVYDELDQVIETVLPDATPSDLSDNPRILQAYDAIGRLVSQTDADGNETRFVYDKVGNQTEIVFADLTPSDPTDNPRQRFEYDAIGQLIAEIDELGNRTEYEYDALGNETLVRDPLGNEYVYTYDARGNLLTATDPLGRETVNFYDEFGRLASIQLPDGTLETIDYDARTAQGSIDALGNQTLVETNLIGEISRVTDAEGGVATFEYDPLGNVIAQTDPNGNLTNYTYDVLGRRSSTTAPEGQFETTAYDAMNRPVSFIDANGNSTKLRYDERGNLLETGFEDSSTVTYAYSLGGNLVSAVDKMGTTTLTYDERNRIVSRTDVHGREIKYAYDDASNLISVQTANQFVKYEYDGLNRLIKVSENDEPITEYGYDPVGNLVEIKHANGTFQKRVYDELDQLIQIQDVFADGEENIVDYRRDKLGRIIRISKNDGFEQEFEYDKIGRLISEVTRSGEEPPIVVTYTYDSNGNRLAKSDSESGEETYTYDKNNRLTQLENSDGVRQYEYDDNGNLLQVTLDGELETAYRWDLQNRLVGIDVDGDGVLDQEKQYDYQGNLIAESDRENETEFLVDINQDFEQIIEEFDADTEALVTKLVYGLGAILSNSAGQVDYFHANHQQSTSALSNDAGSKTQSYTYDVFGEIRQSNGNSANRVLYTGERLDPVSGLYFLRARHYAPGLGRFVSQDPFEGLASVTQSLNRFSYVLNNPVNLTDPSGLAPSNLTETVGTVGVKETTFKFSGLFAAYNAAETAIDALATTVLLLQVSWQFALASWALSDTRFGSTKISFVDVENTTKKGWVKKVGVSYSPNFKKSGFGKGKIGFDFEFPGDGGIKFGFKIKLLSKPPYVDLVGFGGGADSKKFFEVPKSGKLKGSLFAATTKLRFGLESAGLFTTKTIKPIFLPSVAFGFTVTKIFKLDLKVFPEVLEFLGVVPDPDDPKFSKR